MSLRIVNSLTTTPLHGGKYDIANDINKYRFQQRVVMYVVADRGLYISIQITDSAA